MPNHLVPMLDEVFCRLTVIERAGSTPTGEATYTCSCSCGNVVVVRGSHLREGHIKSCGCLKKEMDSERSREMLIDMVGLYINGWNVLIRDISQGYKQAHWVCRCGYCGVTKRVYSGWQLREERVPEGCGCEK